MWKSRNTDRDSHSTCRKQAAYSVLCRWNQDSRINIGEDMDKWSDLLCKLCQFCKTCANIILIFLLIYCWIWMWKQGVSESAVLSSSCDWLSLFWRILNQYPSHKGQNKFNFRSLWLAQCPVRDEASNLKTEDVIMCCLVRVSHTSEGGEKRAWSNGGIMTSTANPNKLGEDFVSCHSFITDLILSHPGLKPRLCGKKPVPYRLSYGRAYWTASETFFTTNQTNS
jgi:hypothetical protein